MSSQQTSIQHNALGWVKKSIDDHLSEITTDLKLFIEEGDEGLLAAVRQRLGEIHGVLEMVEQYGAAMLTEEILTLTDFIIQNEKERSDQTLDILLRAVLQLPDYLEHIQSGHRDIPIVILPLLNDIRSAKKEDLFSEKLLFLPDLSMHAESTVAATIDEPGNQTSKLLAKKLRPVYQYALLKIIKDEAVEDNLKRLGKVCETLEEKSCSEQVARIWWVIGALIESVSPQQLESDVSIKNLLGKVDALFRVILIIGERGLLKRQPIDLIRNFLYYIAQPECDGPKSQAIKTAYRLEEFLPSEESRSEVLDNIAGPNKELLKTVAEVMKTEIESVKSTLEVYVNSDPPNIELLKDIPQELHTISDTLAMLGLGQQRQLIESQITSVKEILDGGQQDIQDKLLSMAAELIQVEHALDQMQTRQSGDGEQAEADVSKDFEMANMLNAVVAAALDGIQKTKSAILDFIADPTRSENIDLCVSLLEETRGGLLLLEKQRAVAVVDGLIEYLKAHDIVEFMDINRLDALSQVVVSLEYYLEALGEGQPEADKILDFADAQIQSVLSNATSTDEAEELVILDQQDTSESELPIGNEMLETADIDENIEIVDVTDAGATDKSGDSKEYSDEDDSIAVVAQSSAGADIDDESSDSAIELPVSIDAEDEALLINDTSVDLESLESEMMESIQSETENFEIDEGDGSPDEDIHSNEPLKGVALSEDAEVLVPGGDPDILEIYLEEAEEEAINVGRLHQDWLLHPEDENAIKNIRRAFHTIKGSGRLVGALKIAEFAADFEQLLNRITEKSILPSDEIIDAVGQAAIGLKELIIELNTEQKPTMDISHLRGLARNLAEFKAAQIIIQRTGETAAITSSADDRISDGATGEIDMEVTDYDRQLVPTETPADPEVEAGEELIDQDEDEAPISGEDPPDPLVLATEDPIPVTGIEEGVPDSKPAGSPTNPTFDSVLLRIYQQEVEANLSVINAALDSCAKSKELIPSEEYYRALHTIHGASQTADISSIGELASLMEKPMKAALSQSLVLDDEIMALYRQGYQALKSMTEELVETSQIPPIPEELKSSLIALGDDLKYNTQEIRADAGQSSAEFIDTLNKLEDSSEDEQDNELLTIFVDEAKELLEMSDQILHDWIEQKPGDDGQHDYSLVMELQRYLHTLKGGAKMTELDQIGNLSHELESIFIQVIDSRLEKSDKLAELLRDSFDLLHKQVQQASENQTPSDAADQIQLLKTMRTGGDEDQAEQKSDSAPSPARRQGGQDRRSALRVEDSEIDQAQEVIKVRSELLDNLVNSAGEVSIYRARMEQQVSGLGSYIGELGQTINRLKNQLRSLEAETDAQIHFSHRVNTEASGDFDPLEMDRYTLIQELSKSLSESVNDLASLQEVLGEQTKDSETLLLQQSRVNTELQDGLIKSRMVKFTGLLSRLRRLVRQSSQELGKKAELVITGEENEVDNKVLDRMIAPLEHIIRNAISHGIETPVDRIKNGKPEIGVITIDITRDGSDVVIKVSDDGAGIDFEKVRSRALKMGLMEKNHSVTDSDLVQFILEPGFSTASHVTQMSGRGVGMDVVDIEIKQLGGTLQIETNPNGTSFVARLPFTLSINQAILVQTGGESYAIPLINIEGISRIETGKLVEHYQQEEPVLEYAGQQFALHYLSKLVGASDHFNADQENLKHPVILGRSGDVRVALHVDEILGNREIVAKALGKQLSQVKGLSGASVLADGSIVLILDIKGVVRHGANSAVKTGNSSKLDANAVTGDQLKQLVMVVDDSITMRRVASKLLKRNNYEVVTAKDGVDALSQLEEVKPDVMLLDIEMPRMDGFELATHMQNENLYSDIPIIMITSRTGEKHRDRALQIGVANYMGKPYQEEELIDNIQSAIGV
jgi:chemosensory pili system protein ChpA (sensor histidine kinase/response regulator)